MNHIKFFKDKILVGEGLSRMFETEDDVASFYGAKDADIIKIMLYRNEDTNNIILNWLRIYRQDLSIRIDKLLVLK